MDPSSQSPIPPSYAKLPMGNGRFRFIQDKILEVSGKEFAVMLGVDPASISKWRTEDRVIPDYIAHLAEVRAAEKQGTLEIPLSFPLLFGLSRVAEARGVSVQTVLLDVIKGLAAAHPPASISYLDSLRTQDSSTKVADSEAKYTAPPHKPTLNNPSDDAP